MSAITPPAPAHRTPLAIRRALFVAAALLGLFLVLLGAFNIVDVASRKTTTESASYDGVRTLVIDGASDVRLTGAGAGAALEVVTRSTEGLRGPDSSVERGAGGELRLSSSCPNLFTSQCGVDYTISVPSGTVVRAEADAGDVTAERLRTSEPLVLDTSAGDVEASGVTAPSITLSSSAGDIEARGLSADSVRLESSAGDVVASLATPGGGAVRGQQRRRRRAAGAGRDLPHRRDELGRRRRRRRAAHGPVGGALDHRALQRGRRASRRAALTRRDAGVADTAVMRPLAALPGVLAAALVLAACSDDPAATRSESAPAVTATPAGTPAPPEEPRPRAVRLTIAVSGDLLPHLPVVARARALAGGTGYRFAPLLRGLRPLLRRADLALCHVETPLVPGPPRGYPSFRTPPALARAIRITGWDACSTASNHTVDAGQGGVESTIRALDRARVRHTGSYASPHARRRPLILRARGVRVAFLSYTASTNGIPPPRPWSVNVARAERILRDARRARRAGARAVIVNLHWGTEYRHAVDPAQRRLARRLMRSRAITAIVGQHAHVVQPIRRVRGRWVVFGAGNLLSNQSSACCPAATQDGMVAILGLRVRGRRARVERIRYVPTWVRRPDYTVVRAGRESWHRTVRVVGRARGLRPVPARPPR